MNNECIQLPGMSRVCLVCGGSFVGRTSQRYCSLACKEAGCLAKHRARQAKYYAQKAPKGNSAVPRHKAPPLVERTCEMCGVVFLPSHVAQVVCSSDCGEEHGYRKTSDSMIEMERAAAALRALQRERAKERQMKLRADRAPSLASAQAQEDCGRRRGVLPGVLRENALTGGCAARVQARSRGAVD